MSHEHGEGVNEPEDANQQASNQSSRRYHDTLASQKACDQRQHQRREQREADMYIVVDVHCGVHTVNHIGEQNAEKADESPNEQGEQISPS